jgi:subtilisin family serine protease
MRDWSTSPVRPWRLWHARAVAMAASTLLLATGSVHAAPRSIHPSLNDVRPGAAVHERFLSRRGDGTVLVELMIQGSVSPALLRARGIEVNTVAGGWLTARCPLGLLTALREIPGIERIDVAERCQPTLDVSAIDVALPSVRTVGATDITGQTGEGVVVGIVDTGVDIGHADLKNPDGTTRIVWLWDQTATTGSHPASFSYGAEYDSVDINDGIVPETDVDGHGTHVITTAAGNGRATGNGLPAHTYVGVAPKADVIAVKSTFATTAIVDGVSYIFSMAGMMGKKAVVNLSLGTQAGPHDGTYGFDLMINELTGSGRIVVSTAGNRQGDDLHGRIDLDGTTPGSMTMSVPTYSKKPGTDNDYLLVGAWYPGLDQISLTVTSPNGATLGPVSPGTTQSLNSSDGFITIFNATTSPTNGDNEINVEIIDQFSAKAPQSGTWTFTFTPITLTSTGVVDAYIYANSLGDGTQLARVVAGLLPDGVIGSPGSADSVITVAAHTTKDCFPSVNGNSYCWTPQPVLDAIAPFSSLGPLRDGTLKPDLAGPGNGITAGRSAAASYPVELIAPDGVHANLAGTSMAAPHVTGAIALLLAQPEWANARPSAIRQRLQSTARADAFTGSVPNTTWGYGKLDVAAAVAPLATLAIPYPPRGHQMAPGTTESVTVVVTGMTADSVTVALSLDGGASYSVPLGTLYGVPSGVPTDLTFEVQSAWTTTEAKVRGVARNAVTTATATSDSLFIIQNPVGVDEAGVPVAKRLTLERNRPNPFNPSTSIVFEIAKAGRASVRVYNVQGALVRTLVEAPLPAGRYRSTWDGRDAQGRAVGSGVYVTELRAEGKRLTQKMSLLK